MPPSSPSGNLSPALHLRRWFIQAPVTVMLGAALCAVWLVCAFQSGSVLATSDSSLARAWMLWGPEMFTGLGFARLIGFLFIHLDIGHIAVNLFLGLLIGREIELAIGSAAYFLAWLISGLGSGLAVLFFSPLEPTGGVSGALYGMMAILVGLALRRGTDLRSPLALVGVNLVYTFLAPSVSLWGHLGGLADGTLVAVVLSIRSSAWRWVGLVALLGAVIAAAFGFISSGGL